MIVDPLPDLLNHLEVNGIWIGSQAFGGFERVVSALQGHQGRRPFQLGQVLVKKVEIAKGVAGPFNKEAWASNLGPVIRPRFLRLLRRMEGVAQKDQAIAGETLSDGQGRHPSPHAFATQKQATRMKAWMRLQRLDHGVPGLKHAMDVMGYYGGPPRLPLVPVKPEAKAEIEAAFADLRG